MSAPRTRHLGPLGVALCLHALGLGAAGVLGYSVAVREEPDTFVVAWKPVVLLAEEPDGPEEEPPFAEDVVLVQPVEELVLADAWSEVLPEPEFELDDRPFVDEPLPEAVLEPEVSGAASPKPLELSDRRPFFDGEVSSGPVQPGGSALGVAASAGADSGIVGGRPGGSGTTPGAAGVASFVVGEPGVGGPGAGAVREAVVVAAPRPVYPRLSQRSGEEGSVLCRLHIDPRGAVVEVEIVESSGHARLDEAAKETLASWRFEPRRQDGRPVPAQLLHKVTFRLTG